jgi:hypothetical protein
LKRLLYDEGYLRYAEENRLPPFSPVHFGRYVSARYKVKTVRPKEGEPLWEGIRLKTQEELEEERDGGSKI